MLSELLSNCYCLVTFTPACFMSIYLQYLCSLDFPFLCLFPFFPPKNYQGDDPYFNKLIRILATRCMTQVLPVKSIQLSFLPFQDLDLQVFPNGIHLFIIKNFRQCTFVAEISALQSFLIMVLLRLSIHTSLLP